MKFTTIAAAVAVVAQLFGATATAQPSAAPGRATSAAAVGGVAGVPLDRADLEAWLDGRIPYALKSGDIAGADIVVVKDGKVLLAKGYGLADIGRKVAMDPEKSLIRPGSTSKLFTWTAVMQLVEQGKLDLDRNVNDYLDFTVTPKGHGTITLRDLMNHRAGFEEGLKGILATDPHGLESTEAYLKNHPRPMLFAPGEAPAYSNYGVSLAGYIVQRVSGEPFERYVERHIFQPLGMTNTTFDQPLPDRFKDALAQGYRTASDPAQPYELIVTRPAGSVTTTAADMARFMIAQLGEGRLGDYQMLRPETVKLMHAPSEDGLPGFATMAHGFFHDVRNGRTVIGHGGDTVVFHTELDLLPEEGVGIFYNFNSRGTNDAVYGARKALFDGFMDRYFPAAPQADQPALASAAKDALAIAGRYQSSRRIEHGFISVFYLLQQTTIAANPDGTISAPGALERGRATFREVGPQLWREVGGTRQLALKTVNGVKTVIDSEDPTSVLQEASFLRSAPLNVTVLAGAFVILLWALLLWPLSALLRRGDRAELGVPAEIRRSRLYTRAAAATGLAYLIGWYLVLQPVMSSALQVYNTGLDPVIRMLQIAALPLVAAAVAAMWSAWRGFRLGAPWLSRIWGVAVAAALLGVVWVGLVGGLIGFDVNY